MVGFDVKRLDIYRKVPKDLTQASLSGAIISITCIACICLLLVVEFMWFISPDIRSDLLVENNNPTDRIPVRLNMSLPK